MYRNVKPLTKEEREMYMWKCPICGELCEEWQDGLNHIVTQHIEEYASKFYSHK